MYLLRYDLDPVKSSFEFLSFDDRYFFCDLNFLALPFYFGKFSKFPRYYRFRSTVVNYVKLKNLSSFFLIFRLHSVLSVKIRSEILFDMNFSSFLNVFRSKKHFGYLLEDTFNFLEVTSSYNMVSNNYVDFFEHDYFFVDNLYSSFWGSTQFPVFISDSSFYFSLFCNRFFKRYQNSLFDVDSFISRFIFDRQKIYSGGFWDSCSKIFLVEAKKPSGAFFIGGYDTGVRSKYFTYFFFSLFVKKIVLKLKFLRLNNFLIFNSLNKGYLFVLNSVLYKLDNFYFYSFDNLFFFNFLYKFWNFTKSTYNFFNFDAFVLMVRIYMFWLFFYFILRFGYDYGFGLFIFRYLFIILMNLFFNFISNSFFGFVCAKGFRYLYLKSILKSVVGLSGRVYVNKPLLRITFRRHALVLYERLNILVRSDVEKYHFFLKWFSPNVHYLDKVHLEIKNFFILFKNLFVYFFRKKFYISEFFSKNSLVFFRFFIGDFFFKSSLFRFKKKFWLSYLFIKRKYLARLLFYYKRKLSLKKKVGSLSYVLRFFHYLNVNNLGFYFNKLRLLDFDFPIFIVKKKLLISYLFGLQGIKFVLNYRFLCEYTQVHLAMYDIVFCILDFFICGKFYTLRYYNMATSRLFLSTTFAKLKFPVVFLRTYSSFVESKYLISNLNFFNEIFLNDVFNEFIVSFFFFGKVKKDFFLMTFSESRVYVFYFFCYFYLLNSFASVIIRESLFNLNEVSFFSVLFTELRFFLFISLIINFDFFCGFDFISFFEFNKRFIQKFSNFRLRVDFFIFAFIGGYIEYFRIFKYNEYIMSNFALLEGTKVSRMLLRRYPDFQLLTYKLQLRAYFLFNFYDIYKIYFSIRDVYLYNSKLIFKSFVKLPFVLFFYIFLRFGRLLWFFIKFFNVYFKVFLFVYSYKALFFVPLLFEFQLDTISSISMLFQGVDYLSGDGFGFVISGLVYMMVNKFKLYFFKGASFWSLFFCDQLFFLFKLNSEKFNKDSFVNFFYQFYRILILDYIDVIFFDNFFWFYHLNILKAVDVLINWIRRGYLSFVQIFDYYFDSVAFDFLFGLKFTLDYLVWDIYNFFRFFDFSFLIFDMNLLLNKFEFDNNVLFLSQTVDVFYIYFLSTVGSFGENSFSLENLDYLARNDFSFKIMLFFTYLFIRDLFLNLGCIFFKIFFFYNFHLINYLRWFSFNVQFNYVNCVFSYFLYFFFFYKSILKLGNNLNFKYSGYVL